MANRHTLPTEKVSSPPQRGFQEGRELQSIGPSDSSDSGSDLIGPGITGKDDVLGLDRGTSEDNDGGYMARGDVDDNIADLDIDSTSDRSGTGERLSVGDDSELRVAADIAPDRIVGADEAGLGGGLDQAEEAQLGVTDEELARRASRRRGG
jgi:hypothetical protein